MPTYKITLVFEMNENGWTESYYLNTPNPLQPSVIFNTYAAQLGSYRQACLCSQANITYVRIATVNVPFAVQTFQFDDFANNNYGTIGYLPYNALLIRCVPTVSGPQKNIFFRGLPSTVFVGTVYQPPAQFTKVITQFINYLLTPQQGAVWGWWGVISKTAAPVTGYAYPVTGYQPIVTTGPIPATGNPLFAGLGIGTKLKVRYSGINGKSELNGTQVVLVTGPNTVQTKDNFGLVPFNRAGNCEYPVFGFTTFFALNPEKLTERKPGRPLFVARGRQPNKART